MKRTTIIIGIFMFLSLFCGVGCTCTCFDTDCRGCGYDCINLYLCGCDCMMEGLGEDVPNVLTKYDAAIAGEDYSEPELAFEQDGDSGEFSIEMKVYDSFLLDIEVCFVQNGVLLGTFTYSGRCSKNEIFRMHKTIQFSHYDEKGGKVYYFINKFEAKKDA